MQLGRITYWMGLAALLLGSPRGAAAKSQRFADLVGPVSVGPVSGEGTLQVPYILWGGDFATFHANGGLSTASGSLFAQQGLSLQLVKGDDFVAQVRAYLKGTSPFLRGTLHMIGMAAEAANADPRTRPVVFLQMTWSGGDHLVARERIKTIQDLKGRTIALQQGGPHVGLLDDLLQTAGISWDQVHVVWTDDITGPNGPAEAFRNDPKIDACFAVTPDMLILTGGLKSVGSGAERTIKGARVLDSTAYRSYAIADVYAVRSDFLEKHPEVVNQFTAGYLRAVEEVVELKKSKSPAYTALLELAISIYGKDALPSRPEAEGLLSDCTFVGYPGNVAFFTDPKNSHGFKVFERKATALAVARGYASKRTAIAPSPIDWNAAALVSQLKKTHDVKQERFRPEVVKEELEQLTVGGGIDDSTIYAFTVTFEPNQDEFPAEKYGQDFRRVLDLTSDYAGAVMAVRGHSDPTKVLASFVKGAMSRNLLSRTGSPGNYQYAWKGKAFDLGATDAVVRAINSGALDGEAAAGENPRELMQAALNLSLRRAQAVRDGIASYAKKNHVRIDESQIQPQGVGVREPFITVPRNMDDVRKNTRVEFRLVRVSPEATKPADFDY
jgi:hypothetical protein